MINEYQQYNIHLLGISEHHLPLADPGYRQKVHEAMNECGPAGRMTHQLNASQESSSQSGRLMGGTGVLAFKESVGRLEPKGKGGDGMGRWSFVHLRRYRLPPITIISIYQVCKQPTNTIGHTAWHQQRRALDKEHRDEHPRTAFIEDLSYFLSQLEAAQHAIIIGGDWNETQFDSQSGIAKLALQHDLIDPWSHIYPDHEDVPTFEYGTKRIDAVFLSRTLLQSVTNIGYSPVGLMAQSDHRAPLIDFDAKKLFGQAMDPLPPITARGVRRKDKKSVTTFIEQMHSHLLANNAFNRGKQLATADRFEVSLVEG
jgi:hypothetical protein